MHIPAGVSIALLEDTHVGVELEDIDGVVIDGIFQANPDDAFRKLSIIDDYAEYASQAIDYVTNSGDTDPKSVLEYLDTLQIDREDAMQELEEWLRENATCYFCEGEANDSEGWILDPVDLDWTCPNCVTAGQQIIEDSNNE